MNYFLLIDDHEIVRSGVKTVLQELFKPCEVYEAENEGSALQRLSERSYTLVVMDVQLPDTNAGSLLEIVKKNYPGTRVLIFSMSEENIYGKRFLKAGALGFVSKKSGVDELVKAITLALENKKYISKNLSEQLATDYSRDQPDNPFDKLSAREFEIAMLLIQGKTITEISNLLSIETSTAGTYKFRLFEKLNVKNIVELIESAKINGVQ